MLRDNMDPAERDGKENGTINLPAQIIMVDKGIPVNKDVKITGLTSREAVVETDQPLPQGQRIGLVIWGIDSEVVDSFFPGVTPSSPVVNIKTQGEVTDNRELGGRSGIYCACIRFVGNLKIDGTDSFRRNQP